MLYIIHHNKNITVFAPKMDNMAVKFMGKKTAVSFYVFLSACVLF